MDRSSETLVARKMDVPPGGGAFMLPRLTIGVFLIGQESHRIAVGSDRKLHLPLCEDEGWILQAGSSGICEYDRAHSYLTVELADSLLDDVGFDSHRGFKPVIGSLDPLLLQLARHATFNLEGMPYLYRETMNLALASHLNQALRHTEPLTASIDDRRLRRAIAYIRDNLSQDISLAALAAEAAMSRYHFARSFKTELGQSPLQYVICQRMERAKTLLKATRAPVAEIALRVGYEDVSRFGQHFRKYSGVTPAIFRQQ